jgi:DNA-binding FrmR family transcriptional regulator
MYTSSETIGDALHQLRLAGDLIHDLIGLLESGPDCEEATLELATIAQTLDRVGFRLLTAQFAQCLAMGSSSDDRGRRLERLERLFLSLA